MLGRVSVLKLQGLTLRSGTLAGVPATRAVRSTPSRVPPSSLVQYTDDGAPENLESSRWSASQLQNWLMIGGREGAAGPRALPLHAALVPASGQPNSESGNRLEEVEYNANA